jgi:hypothetical protein
MCTYIKNLKQRRRLETKHNYCAEMDLKVWEKLWMMIHPDRGEDLKSPEQGVTLLCNLAVPDEIKNAGGQGLLENHLNYKTRRTSLIWDDSLIRVKIILISF